MVILGVDPGTAITGFGIIKYLGQRFELVDYGCIRTASGQPLGERLLTIENRLSGLISAHNPQFMAVEELFFNRNTSTALTVGHARGVILLTAARNGLPIFEYTPLQVKQAVVGYGRADKNQIQQMVKLILGMERLPSPDDAADALAIAICHAHSYRVGQFLTGDKPK